MKTFKSYFLLPIFITFVALILVFYFGSLAALLSVSILIALEITLSFDNAIVNAKVLENMSPTWQRRFINWGIWVAVFGTRVILPVLIVAVTSGLSINQVLNLAIFDSKTYGLRLDEAHYSIGAFGGIFLLMVALKYFIDDTKEIHWIHKIESRLKKFASLESVETIISLVVLLLISILVPEKSVEILSAGIIGILSFLLVQIVTSGMDVELKDVAKSGFAMFMYLNLLDVAFSLDGVIGAFAISTNIFIIAIGLGIGAYFVRSFTLFLVHKKTLKELKYLDHGAHWAIGALALCMLLGLIFHIPEVVTGLIGLLFVSASYLSSRN